MHDMIQWRNSRRFWAVCTRRALLATAVRTDMLSKFSWVVDRDTESIARMHDVCHNDEYIHPLDRAKVPSARYNSSHNDVPTWLMGD